ncbi:MAG: SPOR domain-containing protein [Treponema sp.]|nr:SPOR domain-containing protein [Treponema sp.]
MVSTKIIFLAVLFAAVSPLFAQDAHSGISLTAEIQNIEETISRKETTGLKKYDALVRLARLRQLAGDIDGAAKNWLEAATAIPNTLNENALLSCAYCLAAMGEWERASAALEPLLFNSKRARFLQVCINSWKSGDISALGAIAGNPDYSEYKSEIYFLLWKTADGALAETWKQRLLAEFPQSPEGRLAASETSSAFTVKPSPFWLYLAGRDTFSLLETAAQKPSIAVSNAAPEPQPALPAKSVMLQTGIFGKELNAQAQIAALKKAGFSPLMERRNVNGNEMWAVIVPAQDENRGIRELLAAGFESFPVK